MQSGGKVKTVMAAGIRGGAASENQGGIGQAVNMAKNADMVVLAVGTDLTMGQEGIDARAVRLRAPRLSHAAGELLSPRHQPRAYQLGPIHTWPQNPSISFATAFGSIL